MSIEKKYWTISDIAKELKVPTSMLRHWEAAAPFLAPKKRYKKNGFRKYSNKERDLVHEFHRLVKVELFTLEGAKRFLLK